MNDDAIPTMIFEVEGTLLIPRLPHGPDGVLEPDGVQFLTPDQCAVRFGKTAEDWRARWISVWGAYTPAVDRPVESAPADAGSSTARSLAIAARAGWDIVRVQRFPSLTNAEWAYVCRECDRHRIDPADIWVQRQRDDNGEVEVILISTLKVLRMIGARTGLRLNESAPEFAGPDGMFQPGAAWVAKDPPTAARVFITMAGTGEVVEGRAYFDMCAQYRIGPDGRSDLAEFWKKCPAHMLGKCASAAAHRNAFPLECAGIYTTDEIPVPIASQRPAEVEAQADAPVVKPGDSGVFTTVKQPASADASGIPDDPRVAARWVDESTPELSRLPMELVYADACATIQAAKTFIDGCKRRWPRIFAGHQAAFCAAVMKVGREQPVGA